MNKPSPDELYTNGHFTIPSTQFYDGWVARITGVGGPYIFDREFIRKEKLLDKYRFHAPTDGFYQIKAKSDVEPLDEFVEVRNGIPQFTNFSTVKSGLKEVYK